MSSTDSSPEKRIVIDESSPQKEAQQQNAPAAQNSTANGGELNGALLIGGELNDAAADGSAANGVALIGEEQNGNDQQNLEERRIPRQLHPDDPISAVTVPRDIADLSNAALLDNAVQWAEYTGFARDGPGDNTERALNDFHHETQYRLANGQIGEEVIRATARRIAEDVQREPKLWNAEHHPNDVLLGYLYDALREFYAQRHPGARLPDLVELLFPGTEERNHYTQRRLLAMRTEEERAIMQREEAREREEQDDEVKVTGSRQAKKQRKDSKAEPRSIFDEAMEMSPSPTPTPNPTPTPVPRWERELPDPAVRPPRLSADPAPSRRQTRSMGQFNLAGPLDDPANPILTPAEAALRYEIRREQEEMGRAQREDLRRQARRQARERREREHMLERAAAARAPMGIEEADRTQRTLTRRSIEERIGEPLIDPDTIQLDDDDEAQGEEEEEEYVPSDEEESSSAPPQPLRRASRKRQRQSGEESKRRIKRGSADERRGLRTGLIIGHGQRYSSDMIHREPNPYSGEPISVIPIQGHADESAEKGQRQSKQKTSLASILCRRAFEEYPDDLEASRLAAHRSRRGSDVGFEPRSEEWRQGVIAQLRAFMDRLEEEANRRERQGILANAAPPAAAGDAMEIEELENEAMELGGEEPDVIVLDDDDEEIVLHDDEELDEELEKQLPQRAPRRRLVDYSESSSDEEEGADAPATCKPPKQNGEPRGPPPNGGAGGGLFV